MSRQLDMFAPVEPPITLHIECIAWYYYEMYRVRGIVVCRRCMIVLREGEMFDGPGFVVVDYEGMV